MQFLKTSSSVLAVAAGLIAFGLALAAAGIYVGDIDDAPGAALVGIGLLLGCITFAVRLVRRHRRTPS